MSKKKNTFAKAEAKRYVLDISKYVITALVISPFVKDIENKVWMYILGLVISALAFAYGTNLFDSKKKN